MGLGAFHKKKKFILNKFKLIVVGCFFRRHKKEKPKNIKKCLLIHNNKKLGDIIVISSVFRELNKAGISLSILTDSHSADFLKTNNNIDNIIVKQSDRLFDVVSVLRFLRKINYDLVIDPFETIPNFKHAIILAGLKTCYLLGFDKWYKSFYSEYNSHDIGLRKHMASRAIEIFNFLNLRQAGVSTQYDISIPKDIDLIIKKKFHGDEIIIINPFGAKKNCKLSAEQINEIYKAVQNKHPKSRIIFTGLPSEISSIDIKNKEILPFEKYIYTVALTKYASYIISVDTSLIHIAAAFERPILTFYPKAHADDYPSPDIWGPNNSRAIQIISPSSTVKDISIDDIKKNI